MFDNIYVGSLYSCLNTKKLLEIGITHILNATTMAFTKRKYFNYLDIDVYDNNEEDIKKHFRITNRFI